MVRKGKGLTFAEGLHCKLIWPRLHHSLPFDHPVREVSGLEEDERADLLCAFQKRELRAPADQVRVFEQEMGDVVDAKIPPQLLGPGKISQAKGLVDPPARGVVWLADDFPRRQRLEVC